MRAKTIMGQKGTGGGIRPLRARPLPHDELRRVVVGNAAGRKWVSLPRSGESFSQDAEFDKLAHPVRTSLNMDAVYESMEVKARRSMQIPRR